jgi:hypothetical protein
MNQVKTLTELLNRTQVAALMLTLSILLLGMTTARAQGHGAGGGGGAGKVSMRDFSFVASVGVARGQTVRIVFRIPTDDPQAGSPQGRLYVATNVGVFNAETGAEIKSFELSNPAPGIYMFDIGGNGDDVLFGGENVNRVQLRVQTGFVVQFDRPVDAADTGLYPPSLELIDQDSGRTAIHVNFVKVEYAKIVSDNKN